MNKKIKASKVHREGQKKLKKEVKKKKVKRQKKNKGD